MSSRRYAFLPFVLAALHGVACSGTDTIDAAGPGGPDAAVPRDIAHLVTVDHVAVFQGVQVTLVNDAAVTTPNAPVVPGRPALVRVHARTPPRTPLLRPIAELRVHLPGRPDVVVTDGPRTLTSTLNPVDLQSSFRFELTAEEVRTGATLSVVIRDPTGADPTTVRFPASVEPPATGDASPETPPETLGMNVGPLAPTLRVRFVPIRYMADGSNRLPPLDEATVENYKDRLYRLYPVAKVEMTVRDPFDWGLAVMPDGEGWSQLLSAVIETRSDDNAPSDVYYVGIFNPAATEREYCRDGCVLGVAPPSLRAESGLRAAMVVGYPSERAHGTMAQEIAHAMGRLHAPCGRPASIDPGYPYEGGRIGTWGWDVVDKRLIDPDSRVFDFMSYCNPVWVSDYTFKAIYEELVDLAAEKRDAFDFDPMKVYELGRDGALQARPRLSVRSGTRARPLVTESFAIEDAKRRRVGTVRGSFRPTPEIGGGLLVTPDAIPDASGARGARFARPIPPEK